jgi:hypothetical protein
VNTASLPVRSLATFYQDAFAILEEADIPFLIGGAFAQSRHTSRDRDTKDLDIILRREDVPRLLAAFEHAGYHADVPFPHWLAKIHSNNHYLDVLFGSGNGLVHVDDSWFAHRGGSRGARPDSTPVPTRGTAVVEGVSYRSASASTAPTCCTCCTRARGRWTGIVCSRASTSTGPCSSVTSCCSCSPIPIAAATFLAMSSTS